MAPVYVRTGVSEHGLRMSAVHVTARFAAEVNVKPERYPDVIVCAAGDGAEITTSEYAAPIARIEGSWACRYLPGHLVKLTVWWLEIAGMVAVEPFGYRVFLM